MNDPNAGQKNDAGKVRLELLPPGAIAWIGAALTRGAEKYQHLPPDNWQRVPEGRKRYFGALLRHVFAALAGQERDAESGLPHLAHAGACIVFLLSPLAGDAPGSVFERSPLSPPEVPPTQPSALFCDLP